MEKNAGTVILLMFIFMLGFFIGGIIFGDRYFKEGYVTAKNSEMIYELKENNIGETTWVKIMEDNNG